MLQDFNLHTLSYNFIKQNQSKGAIMTANVTTSNHIQDIQAKEYLSPDEVELLYGFKKTTQAKWRMQGVIPYKKIGRFIRYNHQELKNWIEKGNIA